ncbi:MAG: diguanylate cyclase [Atopobiaceae bacterium]|nr:diguanylate cyclase [Atopobiaceae bacterium]
MHEGLITTNDNCIGCNKCVRICSSFGATVSKSGPDKSSIIINAERCIVCGACIDVCAHGAREYVDNTDAFFDDLSSGKSISVLVAPSFEAKYPKLFKQACAALRRLGVRRLIPVSLGADICTWAYIKCMEQTKKRTYISTSCPVVVSYVEHWLPHLIDRLMPVKSPLMCLATYCREQLGMNERFAFLGPCIAKGLEVERYSDLVQYNLTFPKLMERLEGTLTDEQSGFDSFSYGLGSYYPAPGGLADNLRWLLGDDVPVRIVSGKQYLYEHFAQGGQRFFAQELPYALIDALNCQEGCIEGTARTSSGIEDIGLAAIYKIRAGSKSSSEDSPWNPALEPNQRLARLNAQFAELELSSYLASFVDQGESCSILAPTEDETERIYRSLHKNDDESRQINCSACGYESCHEMMIAIFNGFNSKYNCVYFEKEESLKLTRLSLTDKLTDVMNRNALERMQDDLYGDGHSIGLVVVDVNGLKRENDTKGHAAGDRLIIATAQALANRFGREKVFRTGGDEFLVVAQDYTSEEVEQAVGEVKEHLQTIDVSVSMGLEFSEGYEGNFDVLLRRADARMYIDKALYYETHGKR